MKIRQLLNNEFLAKNKTLEFLIKIINIKCVIIYCRRRKAYKNFIKAKVYDLCLIIKKFMFNDKHYLSFIIIN